jgi:hypothetical protein
MKKLRTVVTILFLSLILVGMTSCEISRHADNGRHRGWFHRHDDHREGPVLIITPDNQNNRDRHYDPD